MFRVLVSKRAKRFLETLDEKRRKKIIGILETLQHNPLPFRVYDMRKLEGMEKAYRIRIGDIRITYELLMEDHLIKVRYLGFRGGAYKKR
ncbi:MAG: type II toxin-antitoxin system RelE/ParE family toxin [Nitrospirae bacterium]|nr:MAG: type II toxin-antitoxin system RelE/ParE family toxin [Nitrospirota bacterium]